MPHLPPAMFEIPHRKIKFSAQNTIKGGGGKSSRLSPESCRFLISETPSPGWARR